MKPKLLSQDQVKKLKFRNVALQESSVMTYGTAVKSYFKFLVEKGYDDQFDIAHIREWLSSFNSASTYNLYLQGLKEYYLQQVRNKPASQKLRVRENFETIKRKRPAREKLPNLSYITIEQVEHLAGKSTERCGALIRGLFWTGCRISEFINIRLSDCRNSDPVTIKVTGKGFKERHVYLPLAEYNQIRRVFKGEKYFVETMRHTRFSRDISKEIKRQAKRLTGLNVHAHTLRHSKAMYMKGLGVSPDQIAKALGHADVTVTLAYYMHGTPGPEEQGIK